MAVTDDDHMARVLAASSITARVAQPVMIAAGGLIATLTSTRIALGVLGLVVIAGIGLLPWRVRTPAAAPSLPAAR